MFNSFITILGNYLEPLMSY